MEMRLRDRGTMTGLHVAAIAASVCAVVAAACAMSVPTMSEERSGLLAYAGILLATAFTFAAMSIWLK